MSEIPDPRYVTHSAFFEEIIVNKGSRIIDISSFLQPTVLPLASTEKDHNFLLESPTATYRISFVSSSMRTRCIRAHSTFRQLAFASTCTTTTIVWWTVFSTIPFLRSAAVASFVYPRLTLTSLSLETGYRPFFGRTIKAIRSTTRSVSSATTEMSMNSAKMDAPASHRNKQVIWDVLKCKVFDAVVSCSSQSTIFSILEIAAGSGIHTSFFASQLDLYLLDQSSSQSCSWYPSDPSASARASIQAYVDDEVAGRTSRVTVHSPLELTLHESGVNPLETRSLLDDISQERTLRLILCINMVHISSWSATVGLFQQAGIRLAPEGILFLYGPFRVRGTCVESNLYVQCRCIYRPLHAHKHVIERHLHESVKV